MIWQIILIVCIALLLFFLLRKLPAIIKLDLPKLNKIIAKDKKIQQPEIQTNTSIIKTEKKQSAINPFMFLNSNREEALFSEADHFFAANQLSDAEKIYLKIATINPQNVKVYNRLGVIYMEKKSYHDAKEAFLEAVKLDPGKASRHYNLSMAYAELREYRNAVESMEKALSLDKNHKYEKILQDLRKKIKYRYKEMKRTED